jgi:hypothetical protein
MDFYFLVFLDVFFVLEVSVADCYIEML